MSIALISDEERVFQFVTSQGVSLVRSAGQKGIGVERDGELIGGVIYDDYNGSNIWMHVAGTDGIRWATKSFVQAVFRYPFIQLGCKRISGWVEQSNEKARKLDEHLGFKREAILKGAAQDGGDVFIYCMTREDCRFL